MRPTIRVTRARMCGAKMGGMGGAREVALGK